MEWQGGLQDFSLGVGKTEKPKAESGDGVLVEGSATPSHDLRGLGDRAL